MHLRLARFLLVMKVDSYFVQIIGATALRFDQVGLVALEAVGPVGAM